MAAGAGAEMAEMIGGGGNDGNGDGDGGALLLLLLLLLAMVKGAREAAMTINGDGIGRRQ